MTILYTFGTFLLWVETRQSLKLAIEESKRTQKQIRTQLISNLVTSHRDLYRYILSNENFIDLLCENGNIVKFRSEFLASLLINNVLQIFYHYKQGNIDEKIWQGLVEDTKELFGWSIVRDRWSEYRKFCIDDFRLFIEEDILGKLGREEIIKSS